MGIILSFRNEWEDVYISQTIFCYQTINGTLLEKSYLYCNRFFFIDCTFYNVTNIPYNPIIYHKIMELLNVKFVVIIYFVSKCSVKSVTYI